MTTPVRMVRMVLTRDKGRCVLNLPGCTRAATTADHRANRGHGGSSVLDDPAVLIAACWHCNGQKEDAHGDTRLHLVEDGLRVQKASTNEATVQRCRDTPVTYPDGSSWFLRSSGIREET